MPDNRALLNFVFIWRINWTCAEKIHCPYLQYKNLLKMVPTKNYRAFPPLPDELAEMWGQD